MKFTILFALAALLTIAVAQGLGDLPDCSKSCATGSIPQNCGIDFTCVCKSKSFLADVACCIADKCSKADQDTTIKVAKSICARGGVTDLPADVVCSSSKLSSSSSANSTETGTNSSAETSGATKTSDSTSVTGTKASTTASKSVSSSASSASAAATSTGVAAVSHKDSSLVAAAGAAAAFAILI
ncbi:Extracellular membrane protein, CFEM domain [Penicillium digitatum]|uniref:CFEM domain-containing protein n=3 Tax=Penicillium digitatum TaxID=36651 RepID=K9FK88_PEND2|nr:hypothetical protein PDIP_68510 [Penicillium digitatum Pd1]EKV08446.1 hypothetical protein PDIP_68510 [Penicillium digitatum Pd1]EKV09955.1 hypothetical protein PDIG_59070 [Penicillium digitatum PHI26]KAG0158789.1 hypothetical protein PDIDSM_6308 [Penicillium digitatum]QQK41719.1 Extracellular membrane protein, CFEM domain [Penicillium digitatum]